MNIFKCKICGFTYRDKKWAEKCEAFCKKHDSCSTEITKHSIERSKNR
ncbi:MAG TPA: hypothetical protein VJH90_02710 [archaeon]|nr:hypothetical protein [archaeon]